VYLRYSRRYSPWEFKKVELTYVANLGDVKSRERVLEWGIIVGDYVTY